MHKVLSNSIFPPFPEDSQIAMVAMGCFWAAEKVFWQVPGVISTHVGYSGGHMSSPTHKQVSSGKTGHAEVVRVVYNPQVLSFSELLKIFWENHLSHEKKKKYLSISYIFFF